MKLPRNAATILGVSLLGLLAAGTVAALPPLRCGFCAGPPGATLDDPLAYLALSPVMRMLDALSLLAVRQHVALLLTVLVAYAAWRTFRVIGGPGRGLVRAALYELAGLSVVLVVLVGIYAAAVVFPRPQSRIVLEDPDELVVDFHSHTLHSHDVRDAMTVERNREWHRALGFDVAYVTDHSHLPTVAEIRRSNPARAGDGIVLLPGVELRFEGTHVVLLGVGPADTLYFPGGNLDPGGLRALRASRTTPVPLILALPGPLDPTEWGAVPDAVEGIDAAPRGLAQLDRERDRIAALGRDLDLPLLASTNNHGWFAGAVAWSVVRVPGWREMRPDELDRAIGRLLVDGGPDAFRIVERARLPEPAAQARLAGTLPLTLLNVARTLPPADRVVWLLWGVLLVASGARRPSPESAGPGRPEPGPPEPAARRGGSWGG